MKRLLVLAVWLLAITATAAPVHSQLSLTGAGGKGSVAGFQGVGDVKSGATMWWGLRAYNAAYATGSNPAMDVCDTATGLTCSTINILSTGFVDRATALAASACATACGVQKIYDQTGNAHHATQANKLLMPVVLFSGCPSGNICLQFVTSGNQHLDTTAITQAQPFSMSAVAERYATFTAFNGILSIGASLAEIGFGPTAGNMYMYAGSTITAAAADSALHAVQGQFNGASSDIYIDGSRTTTSPGTAGGSSQTVRIGDDGSGSHPSEYFYETGLWSSSFSNSDEAAINTNQHGTSGWNF